VGPPTPRLDVLASEGLRLPDFNVEVKPARPPLRRAILSLARHGVGAPLAIHVVPTGRPTA
jgi:hypothetical protein